METKDNLRSNRKVGLVFIGFLLVIGFFLWQEHQAHLLGVLPYLLLLLCPAMHLFMHRGHGGSHHGDGGKEQS